jgi:hypothetical protein
MADQPTIISEYMVVQPRTERNSTVYLPASVFSYRAISSVGQLLAGPIRHSWSLSEFESRFRWKNWHPTESSACIPEAIF